MIHGIGTDLCRIERVAAALGRHGDRFAERILFDDERRRFLDAPDRARFLAMRFAAKEAFGKALGTGIRPPATLHAVRVTQNDLGRPGFSYAAPLAQYLRDRKLMAHLSLSDDAGFALAFVVIESEFNA